MTTSTHPTTPHHVYSFGTRCLTGAGLFCYLLACVFCLAAIGQDMNLSRLGYVVAMFMAFGVGGLFMDTADDIARKAANGHSRA
jgi:hypothetical protein